MSHVHSTCPLPNTCIYTCPQILMHAVGSFAAVMISRTRESSCCLFSPNTCSYNKENRKGLGAKDRKGKWPVHRSRHWALSGWDGSREGGRSSLWHLGCPLQGGYEGWAQACPVIPKALEELETVLVCVPPDSFQPWPCRLPSRAKSEHLCGFFTLSPTICPTLGHATLTPWLQLWRSPGPCSCGGLLGLAVSHWTVLP